VHQPTGRELQQTVSSGLTNDGQNIVTDIDQFSFDLGLVVLDDGELIGVTYSVISETNGTGSE
jgi:hypothetical protein